MNIKKIVKELAPYVIITIVVVLIRTFIVTPVQVDGRSMAPTLKNNEILILNKFDHSIERFDIVVLDYGDDKLVKRIIGLPGEYIKYVDSKLFVNGKEINESFIDVETNDFKLEAIGYTKIPTGYYFVVGDNRGDSQDSRIIGLIKKDSIKGTVSLSISSFKKVN